MWYKLFLVTVLAATLVQSYVPQYSGDELKNYEEVEKLKGIFDKLKAIIEKAIQKALDVLAQLKDTLKKKAEAIVEELKEQLQEQVNKLLKELKDLKKRAEKLGIDIRDCLEGREQSLIDLPKKLGKEIIKCGEDKVNEGKAIIDEALAKVKGSIKELNTLVHKYKECGDMAWNKRVACYAKITAEITKAAASIPGSLVECEKKATSYIQTLFVDLKSCGLSKIYQAETEGQALIKEITTCIESKISPEME